MIYKIIGNLYPKKIKKGLVDLITYSNINTEVNKFLGFILVFNLLFSILFGFYIGAFFNLNFWLIFVVVFFVIIISEVMLLNLNAEKKGKFIESVLPDALQLMSSNLKAGLSVDRALLLSMRPEFGPLKDEINLVGRKITSGMEITRALMEMSERVKSKKLEKTMLLITSGLKSGGELAKLLEQTSEGLLNQNLVDKKIRASVGMYVMFILVAICIGAPMLFGLSSYLIEILTTSFGNIDMPDISEIGGGGLPFAVPKVTISLEFLLIYIVSFLVVTSFLGSLIVGLISKGNEKEGFKYIIPVMVVSILLFFVVRLIVKGLLGGMFAMQ
ncbi:MAG: type II secretion system F family protein [Nanoarchaeota archaeon]|nr:type II secretion system F family protein [Nanoarchaeota archaeon]